MPKEKTSIIKVIGVGGGGGNAVNHMYKQGIKGVDFIVCNTDAQDLDKSPVPIKIQLGPSLTEGLGAGAKAEIGRNAAIETIDYVKEILSNNTKMVFITAGMGGGTGTGASPIIAGICKEMGILTVGIVSTPFAWEGPKRAAQAENGLKELRENVDALLIIDNNKITHIYGDMKMKESYGRADDILTTAAKGIAEIITTQGLINVDFNDVRTVLTDSGAALMGTGIASGENRALLAARAALTSPLLDESEISGARYILLNITSGTDEISNGEFAQITEFIQNEAGNNADLIYGMCEDETLGDSISVTLIASGFANNKKVVVEQPVSKGNNLRMLTDEEPVVEQPVVASDEPVLKIQQEPLQLSLMEIVNNPQPLVIKPVSVKPVLPEEPITYSLPKNIDLQQQRLHERAQIIKVGSQKTTQQEFDEKESVPAYIRRGIQLSDVAHSSTPNVSQYTLTENNEGRTEIRPNNSFLHGNVD